MGNKPNLEVGGLRFGWDLDKGRFTFEGEDSILFWVSSAMKTFFDTIEEVSGDDSASVVMETTGFRQGQIVGEYFKGMDGVGMDEIAKLLPNTYASAGWGTAEFRKINKEEQTFTLYIKDDWEYKINIAQGKNKGGTFLPAHYAGILTSVFGTNIWYRVVQYQLEGHEYSVYEYFPSNTTITQNIHQLARKKEVQEIVKLEQLVEEKTKELKELIKRISSPIIPVLEGIVVVPLLGRYDEERSEELVTNTLRNLPEYKANYLVLDLTGLDQDITSLTASLIEKLGTAASLIGTKTILVGVSAKLSLSITQLNIELSKFDCFQTLEHGIYYALGQQGRKII